jgi:pimeloyl-ACP methyl ester carboxylesterase
VFSASHRGGRGTPLVCLHGFTDTWRTWELVLPRLERWHDVLAPTLPGHAGGPPLEEPFTREGLIDALEAELDAAGFATPHLVGNSLGAHLALQLAARGRAASVVAFAPAGGWARGDRSYRELLLGQLAMVEQLQRAAPHADAIVASRDGRRRATELLTTGFDHLPAELIAHQLRGAAACTAAPAMVEHALRHGYDLDALRVTCPVRVVWGTADRLLPWPAAAARYRRDWLPHADWVELSGIGHCPQLDVPLEAAELILGFTRR